MSRGSAAFRNLEPGLVAGGGSGWDFLWSVRPGHPWSFWGRGSPVSIFGPSAHHSPSDATGTLSASPGLPPFLWSTLLPHFQEPVRVCVCVSGHVHPPLGNCQDLPQGPWLWGGSKEGEVIRVQASLLELGGRSMWPFACSGVWVSGGSHFTQGWACSLLPGGILMHSACGQQRRGMACSFPGETRAKGRLLGLSLGHGRSAWGHKFHASFYQAGTQWEDPGHPHPSLLSLVSQAGRGRSLTRSPMLGEQGEPPSWVQREGLSARRFQCKGCRPASPV